MQELHKLILSPEGFLAKMSVAPVSVKVSKMLTEMLQEADFGGNMQGSLAKLDQNGSWAKMCEGCCQLVLTETPEEILEPFSGTWPTWGIMLNGNVMERKPLERRTKEKECSSWRTPDANLGARGAKSAEMYEECKKTNKHALNLLDQVKHECNWPTPTVADVFTGSLKSSQQKPGSMHSVNLSQCVNWPIPRAREGNSGEYGCKSCERNANKFYLDGVVKQEEKIKGQLNADWVEILMGLPINWTNAEISNEELEQWPGWPAPMGAGENWVTPQANASTQGMEGLLAREKRNGMHATRNLTAQIEVLQNSQYSYEPPRVIEGQKNRAKRLKALGNGCIPQQVFVIFQNIVNMENRIEGVTR